MCVCTYIYIYSNRKLVIMMIVISNKGNNDNKEISNTL